MMKMKNGEVVLSRSYLIDMVFEMMGAVNRDAASAIVKDFFDIMVKGLSRDGELRIKDFGIFKVYRRKECRIRNFNPNTPHIEFKTVPAHNIVYFRPASVLRSLVNHQPHVTRAQRYPKTRYKPTGIRFNDPEWRRRHPTWQPKKGGRMPSSWGVLATSPDSTAPISK